MKQQSGQSSNAQDIMPVLVICKKYKYLDKNERENLEKLYFFRRSGVATDVTP